MPAGQPGILNMSADPKPLQAPDPLDTAADQVIAACDGDVHAAVRALIVAKGLLEAELMDVYAATSLGSVTGANKIKPSRRIKAAPSTATRP